MTNAPLGGTSLACRAKVERIWRREGLKVPSKQPKSKRLWFNDEWCIPDVLWPGVRRQGRASMHPFSHGEDGLHHAGFTMGEWIGYIESFNARVRDALLNGELF